MMKRRILYGVLLAVLGLNLVVGARVYSYSVRAAEEDVAYPYLRLFSYVMERIRKDYVDGAQVTYKDLVYGALNGMLNTLDPHSEFLEPKKYKDLQDDTQGAFGGLGIVISMKDNYVTVVSPMEDTPGFKAGILAGDRIVKIGGKSAEKLSLQEAVRQLRGEPGTDVSITIFRPSSGTVKELSLTRAVIKVDVVKDINGKKEFPLLENKIGYIRLTQFGEKTSEDLDRALRKVKDQGAEALVLDLRWNPGGLLDQAVHVCEKFVPRGELVVTTEGQTTSQNKVWRARGRGDVLDGKPIVLLVNLGSASASEIVAGALQDLKRAVVVGEKTFGKGSVQSILQLEDGSAMRLTTAKYYTPSHKVIHENGIMPDITVEMTDDQERAVLLKRAPGGLESLEDKERERVEATEDIQLNRALDMLKGIMLFSERLDSGPSRPEKIAAR